MRNEAARSADPDARPALAELEQQDAFQARHIGPGAEEQAAMLALLGLPTRAALMEAVVPAAIRLQAPLALPGPRTEAQALADLKRIAGRNEVFRSFIGQGYYSSHLPAVIQRNVLESPAWYTSYTPYQAEISQGRLEALIVFQTMVCDLTGMAIANASMLDEATAAAEAMTLCLRAGRGASRVFHVAEDVFPQTIDVLRTRAEPLGIELAIGPAERAARGEGFGVLLQFPAGNGDVPDYRALTRAVRDKGALVAVAADLLALALLAPPGEWGADVVVGSTQRFGVPLGFGGPHAAYFATRDELKRHMPGRLVGVTVDSQGGPAYRLALQTREQHIRLEKATSNICTAQVLLAVLAAMYAVYHGPGGLRRIAERVQRLTGILAAGIKQAGLAPDSGAWFDTLTVTTGTRTGEVLRRAEALRINLRAVDHTRIGISLDETATREDVAALWQALLPPGQAAPDFAALAASAAPGTPPALRRTSAYLTHPVFNRIRSETDMLRYLRGLADKDLALDRCMIPLGSCTMKLNATSEMLPLTWPELAALHPFAPPGQAAGTVELVAELERMLCAVTGYAAVSFQPNAGSQGEYCGLLVIRAYHRSRGEGRRDVCLIPSSAHGTNPASAQMAGLQVVVVACDEAGNVDLADLRAKAEQHGPRLAALMVTYPSTHGVFEAGITEICDIVHRHGGQVYVDGANLNALMGWAAPGKFGGDVSHLNLHKTFCIPHGGGGPGVGPVAVAAHLAPFLPGHRALTGSPQRSGTSPRSETAQRIGAVAAAPYGSAGILPISWMYIALLGAAGLRACTEVAVLNANYVARRLAPHYPILYTGPGGWVAHECILDLRPLKEASGITVDDVAKRLMDYGFHAPTMSFPVPGTLMVEPTESESKAELDRFVDALIAIRAEIRAVADGKLEREDNPLKHAPHTAAMVTADAWPHKYPRELAAYPLPGLRAQKYWPPVGRADNAYGDRNLFCTCIPAGETA
jgi:glycine dehydrogenase